MRNLLLVLLISSASLACNKQENEPDPDATTPLAARSIEAIADEYLAAMLERFPEIGTNYSLPGARHDRQDGSASVT